MSDKDTIVLASKFEYRGVTCQLSIQVSPAALEDLAEGSPSEYKGDVLEGLAHSLAPDMTRSLAGLAKSFYRDLVVAYADSLKVE